MDQISNTICFVLLGVTGAVSGSGVFPPTTQSGSFTASPAPVQASNPKEKVSTETCFTPQFEKHHVKCIMCDTVN